MRKIRISIDEIICAFGMYKSLFQPPALFSVTIVLWLGFMICILMSLKTTETSQIEAVQAITPLLMASWYGDKYKGKKTASGEVFDPTGLTCASWDYPFGTTLLVRHKDKAVFVRVNDRGPAKHLYAQGRTIDLSREAFSKLSDIDTGVIRVEIIPLNEIPIYQTQRICND